MSEAGQILAAGQTVPFNEHIFRVEKVVKHRIIQCGWKRRQKKAI